ncbi:MAG: hypothetical protein GXC72_04915 [Chitinophagaceae bacterium]|jgi:hypothetical protein|nr:hypothetical protein [Chitinophagaceae bacterium]
MNLKQQLICLLWVCLSLSAVAQADKQQLAQTSLLNVVADSTRVATAADSVVPQKNKPHQPRLATIRSAIIPGWGQAYNKQYWKIPVVYGVLAIPAGLYFYNNSWYKKSKFAYEALLKAAGPAKDSTDLPLIDPKLQNRTIETVQNYRNIFRRDRDYSVLWFILAWGLQVVDATVFGHLKDFDVSDDLSMRVSPTFNPQTRSPGFGLVLSLKNPTPKPIPAR